MLAIYIMYKIRTMYRLQTTHRPVAPVAPWAPRGGDVASVAPRVDADSPAVQDPFLASPWLRTPVQRTILTPESLESSSLWETDSVS